ncbi:MAG: outer membrane protein assembly factor BamD [Phycisphaera sp.]|nr:outer membrane protein assembly factor BamD [Phycisphaera sp.]
MYGHRIRTTCAVATVVTTILVGASVTLAQETFELAPDGTFRKVKTYDPSTVEGQLQGIRTAIAQERYKDAINAADDWIDANPNNPGLAQAYLLRADAKAARGDYFKALFDYEYVLRAYPGTDEFAVAQERELKIAEAFSRGVKRRLWGMRIMPAGGEAEELLIRIQERAPGSKVAERAGKELGDFYYRDARMARAAEAYELFVENYPESQWQEYAMQRQIMANLATFKGPRFDATGLIEAQRRLEDYQEAYPAAAERIGSDALLVRVDESLATRSLLVAKWYERTGKKVSAIYMYKRVIKDHPGSAAARRAVDRLRELDPRMFDKGEAPVVNPDAKPAADETAGPSIDSEANRPRGEEKPIRPAPDEPGKPSVP